MDCKRHRVRLDDGPWQDLIVGLHGEYLVPLLDFDSHDVEESPHFELVVPGDGGVTGDPVQFTDFNVSEQFLDEHMLRVTWLGYSQMGIGIDPQRVPGVSSLT